MCKVYRKGGQGLQTTSHTPSPITSGWSYSEGFLAAQHGPASQHVTEQEIAVVLVSIVQFFAVLFYFLFASFFLLLHACI